MPPPTDTSEKGLENLIMRHMTGIDGFEAEVEGVAEKGALPEGHGWIAGSPKDYDRASALDVTQLFSFLIETQLPEFNKLGMADYKDKKNINRLKFLDRISNEIRNRGVIDVLRKGIKHGDSTFDLFYGTPTPGNAKSAELFQKNRFSVTRQLRYSLDETQRALDLCTFINGLPIMTFELKNSLTKQTVADAVEQYKKDRNPKDRLFEFKRCMVHFAVDDAEVRMCTELKGKASWFLPFNQGYNDGAGNPPNPHGLKTDYLWKTILSPTTLTDIIESYAQVVKEKNEKTGKTKEVQIFPRFHQWDVVRRIIADVQAQGVGFRYLIQHSAGSGKSNSIAWLAHQLVGLKSDGKDVFDTVIVVTDRKILDRQTKNTVKGFTSVASLLGLTQNSGDLRRFIEAGKKIIISTVQKFPVIYKEIGDEHRERKFAIIIDEAHSSQGGKATAAMSRALGQKGDEEGDESLEDQLNKLAESKKLLTNASYFAFTATPKPKTLETFGIKLPQPDGKVKHRPFHSYTMKQAIQEGFILDVLRSWTPVSTFLELVKKVEDDPLFDARKAKKKLWKYVESRSEAIEEKAELMVDHFLSNVIAHGKIGGKARAMVVCNGIERAIQYFHAIQDCLTKRKSPYQAIVAFSGEPEYQGVKVTEASLNSFPSNDIAERFQEDPYRFLVCADKFQTGYDEPLLHTMYVDKTLNGIKAVQTLSRLNRAHPQKHDVFVLDFINDAETITESFEDYYRATILSDETDPNKLHNLVSSLDDADVYSLDQVTAVVTSYLAGETREKVIDPILDGCVATYQQTLDEDEQVKFKGDAKAFVRTYDFLSSILPYTQVEWEKRSIFMNMLIPKLPAPQEEDLAQGILELINMDDYRVEKKATMKLALADEDAVIDPAEVGGGGKKPEPELERLSSILKSFNDQFGKLFKEPDRVARRIKEEVAEKVAADQAYQNAKKNTPFTARIQHDKALEKVMLGLLKDDTEVYKQFAQNESFKRFVADMVYEITNRDLPKAA
jgi:type I restriction enzyme R subunit